MSDDINSANANSGAGDLTQAELLSLRGDQLAAEGLCKEAIGAYKESIELDATVRSTHYKLAHAYYDNREYSEAEATFQKVLALKPFDRIVDSVIGFYLGKVREAADLNRFEESLMAARYAFNYFYPGLFISPIFSAAMEALERIDREDSDAVLKRTACLYASYISSYGYQYIRFSEPKLPWHWYEKARRHVEPPGERDPLEWKIHYRAGMDYWHGLGSVERWRPLLSPEDYSLHPRYEEACEAFKKSVELYKDARKTFERGVRPARDLGCELTEYIFPFEMLSASYIKTGRFADAIDALREGLTRINPDNILGATRGQLVKAIVYNLPHDASLSLSEYYEYLGEHAAAIECLFHPIESRIGDKKYHAEAVGLIQRAEEIVEKHSVMSPEIVEQLPKIAELRKRLEAAR